MKKFTKVLGVLLIIMAITLSFCMTKKVSAEGEAIVTINFLDKDGNTLDFSDYSKIGTYYTLDSYGYVIGNIPYSYEWSNGSTGSGVSDSNGMINITPADTSASSSVVIKIDNSSGAAPWFGYTDLSAADYYKVEQDGNMATLYTGIYYGYISVGNNTSSSLNYYYGYDSTKPGIININFRDYLSEESINFNQYDAIGDLSIGSAGASLTYSYEWSNGESGTSTTDANGNFSIPRPQGETTSCKVTFESVPYPCNIKTKNVDNQIIDIVRVDGEIYKDANKYYFNSDTEVNLDYYTHEYSKKAYVKVNFKHLDGTDWVLGNSYVPLGLLTINNNLPEDPARITCTYEIDYGNGNVETGRNGQLMADLNSTTGGKYIGTNEINITVNTDTNLNVISAISKYQFSKMEVNGTKIDFDDEYATARNTVGENETINITIYHRETGDATIGLYSYDGTLNADNFNMKYLPHFAAIEYYNVDIANYYYWTVEGDDTKHYFDRSDVIDNFIFEVAASIGKTITIHNIPPQHTYGWHDADGSFPYMLDFLLSQTTGNHLATSLDGEPTTAEKLEELGIYPGVYIQTINENGEIVDGQQDVYAGIASSGNGPKVGWDYRYYVVRKASTFMFQKNVNENDSLVEDGKMHHFKIKLTDVITNEPVKGKVAYYVFDSLEDTFNSENVKYAEIDSEGKADVYLKAGQYIKLGRMVDDEDIFNYLVHPLAYGASPVYAPELGALPYNVAYEIEEVDEDYEGTLLVEDTDKGNGIFDTSIVGMEKNGSTAQEFIEKLGGAQFINTRKIGNLTVKKIIEGENTKDKFKFTVKIIDSAKEFPEELTYKKSDGTTGTLRFVKGGNVTIKDRDDETNEIECTEYTTEIELGNKEEITIEGIPSGAKYEVTESEETPTKYKSTSTNATGYIKPEDSEEQSIAIFTNKEEEEKSNIIDRIISGDPKTGDVILLSAIALAISMIVLRKTALTKKKSIKRKH